MTIFHKTISRAFIQLVAFTVRVRLLCHTLSLAVKYILGSEMREAIVINILGAGSEKQNRHLGNFFNFFSEYKWILYLISC